MIAGLFSAGMQSRSQEPKIERKVTRLDDSNPMAQFGVTVYKEDEEDIGAKKGVQWEETDEQREWRLSMDKDGRHQRVSQLSKETEGDSRVVSQLDAEYRHDEVVKKQVEQIQLEQEGEPGMPKSGMLATAAAERAREFQNKLMLEKLETMFGDGRPRTGPTGKERLSLVAPRTPVLAGLEPGPLGNQLEWVAGERAKSRGLTPASPGRAANSDMDDEDEENEEQEAEDEEVRYLEKAFRALDSDGDGKVGPKDLQEMLKRLDAPKYSKAEMRQMIFEVDDDCDGYMGWDDCSNVWVRGKEPLVHNSAYEPRQMFELLDFLVLDVRHSKEHRVTGRVNNTEMLKLFKTRYGNLVELELTDETEVGDAQKGISFSAYAGRSRRIHDAHFFAEKLNVSENLGKKRAVSRKKKAGYRPTQKEAHKQALKNVEGFVMRAKEATGFYDDDQIYQTAQVSHLPQLFSRQNSSRSSRELTLSRRKARSPSKTRRLRGIDELYRWAGVPFESRVMLDLSFRTGDRKNAMIMMNQILAGYVMFEGNTMAIVRLCDLLMKEKQKIISEDERSELLDLTKLVRESKSPAALEALRLAEERAGRPMMRDLASSHS